MTMASFLFQIVRMLQQGAATIKQLLFKYLHDCQKNHRYWTGYIHWMYISHAVIYT